MNCTLIKKLKSAGCGDHVYNPSTQEAYEFKVCLGYIERLCVKINKIK
jgi:hypothetical protein